MRGAAGRPARVAALALLAASAWSGGARAAEPLVILASPSVRAPLEALARAYEARHPSVRVRLSYATALHMRQMIADMQNTGRHHVESGPFHLIAPAGRELLDRLEARYYVLPGTKRPYAVARLVLVAPAEMVEAPDSFAALAEGTSLRVAVVDPKASEVGRLTEELLDALGLAEALRGRVDVAHDTRGVLDHLLHGQADAGIILSSDAYRERERVRVTAKAPPGPQAAVEYWIAMERFCPDRRLCEDFLAFTGSPEARAIVERLGYGAPDDGAASGR